MVRVGVEASIDESLLGDFTKEVELVRIPAAPVEDFEVDFWVSPMFSTTIRSQLPHVRGFRVFQSLWAGVDLLLKLLPAGITLCDARGVHDIPTSEWVVAVVLAMQKNLPFYGELQRREDWKGRWGAHTNYLRSRGLREPVYPPVMVDELADQTALIVGYGSIGSAVEARLEPFGTRILRVARHVRQGVAPVSELDGLLGEADIVILTAPLTAETRHLIDTGRLARMKTGALLVNAARGALVDADGLLQALLENRLRAAVDVTDPEPLPPGHPLWKAPNLMITPHVAGASGRVLRRALKLAGEQAQRYARGEPLINIVSGDY